MIFSIRQREVKGNVALKLFQQMMWKMKRQLGEQACKLGGSRNQQGERENVSEPDAQEIIEVVSSNQRGEKTGSLEKWGEKKERSRS